MSQQQPEELERRMDAQSRQLRTLRETVESLQEELGAVRDELQEARTDRDRLQEQLDELHERTDLLRLVKSADKTDAEQRSGALLQHLQRKAEHNGGKAALDHDAAEEALHYPNVDRTAIYQDMRRAAALVGDESVCWYDNGVLKLDLEEGSIQQVIADVA